MISTRRAQYTRIQFSLLCVTAILFSSCSYRFSYDSNVVGDFNKVKDGTLNVILVMDENVDVITHQEKVQSLSDKACTYLTEQGYKISSKASLTLTIKCGGLNKYENAVHITPIYSGKYVSIIPISETRQKEYRYMTCLLENKSKSPQWSMSMITDDNTTEWADLLTFFLKRIGKEHHGIGTYDYKKGINSFSYIEDSSKDQYNSTYDRFR